MPKLQPYHVTELRASSEECEYCEEGAELEEQHAHAFYVQREGASHRTADELAELFILETADLIRADLELEEEEPAPYVVPAWIEELELEGWAENPDDSQGLSDEIQNAESALYSAGFYCGWDDGYNIGRILEPCAICEELCYAVSEAHASYWRALDGDSLSYAPILHDHAPAEELEGMAPYARDYLERKSLEAIETARRDLETKGVWCASHAVKHAPADWGEDCLRADADTIAMLEESTRKDAGR